MPEDTHTGKICPFCQIPIEVAADMAVCPLCNTPHHSQCWQGNPGCSVPGCEGGHVTVVQTQEEGIPWQKTTASSESKMGRYEGSRTWAIACHLIALLAIFRLPFANIFGPLAIWLYKRKDDPFVDDQGKEALNFQLSFTLYGLFVFIFSSMTVEFISMVLIVGLTILNLVLVVVAGATAKDGVYYRYPYTIRFIP